MENDRCRQSTIEFCEPVDKNLECGICYETFLNPYSWECCGYTVCETCFIKNRKIKGKRRNRWTTLKCPVCRSGNRSSTREANGKSINERRSLPFRNRFLDRFTNTLPVRCLTCESPSTFERTSLSYHIARRCEKWKATPVRCPMQCKWRGTLGDLSVHLLRSEGGCERGFEAMVKSVREMGFGETNESEST